MTKNSDNNNSQSGLKIDKGPEQAFSTFSKKKKNTNYQ
jgi:hypothetical protein